MARQTCFLMIMAVSSLVACLETLAPKLTQAMAARSLKPSDMVNVVWAFAAEDITAKCSRDIYDQCSQALLGFPPTDYVAPCVGCPPSSAQELQDQPCPVIEEQAMIPLISLSSEELGRVAWAFARARNVDSRHRTVTDRPVFDLIAKAYVGEGHCNTASSDLSVGLLQIYSSISHYDSGLYDQMALSLSLKIHDFADPALALSVLSSFSRVKHGRSKQAKAFLNGVYDKVLNVVHIFEPQELVQVASCMAELGVSSKPLMLAICDKIVKEVKNMHPADVLSLVRALAAVQHQDETFVFFQETLLSELRINYLEQDFDELSSHCGSGADGVERRNFLH
jgi:hypothetical protein